MSKIQFIVSLVLFMLAQLSCLEYAEKDEHDSLDDVYTVRVISSGPSGFRAVLPDGTIFTDPAKYAEELPAILQSEGVSASDVTFVIDLSSQSDTAAIGSVEQALNVNGVQYLGPYVLSWQIRDSKLIGGCFGGYATPGGALRLNSAYPDRSGRVQYWDIHIGRYFQNGRSCSVVYESVSGWSSCNCWPTRNELTTALAAAMTAAGVYAAAAWTAAQAAAPVIVPLMAL